MQQTDVRFTAGNVVRLQNYFPMIRMLAREAHSKLPDIAKRWIEVDDFDQEGRLAVVNALPKLDRSRARPSTFFYTAVANYFRNRQAGLVCMKRLSIVVPLDEKIENSLLDPATPAQPPVVKLVETFVRIFVSSPREVRVLCMALLSGSRGVMFSSEAVDYFREKAATLQFSMDDCTRILQDTEVRARLCRLLCNRSAMEEKQCSIKSRPFLVDRAVTGFQNMTAQ